MKIHLDGGAISKALVDTALLTAEERFHLSHCAQCREEIEKTASALNRIGRMAEKMAPGLIRKVRLPVKITETRSFYRGRLLNPVFMTAMAAVVILVVFQFRPAQMGPRVAESDEQLMKRVAELVQNPMSSAYQGITDVIDPTEEDDPTTFIVPEVEKGKDISINREENGVLPC